MLLGGTYLGQAPLGGIGLFDYVPPGVTLGLTGTATRISGVSGKNESDFTLTSDEAFLAYEIKAVPSTSSPRSSGTLIEAGGGGAAGVPVALDVTGAELLAAMGEGTYIIKVFTQDTSGNWSS